MRPKYLVVVLWVWILSGCGSGGSGGSGDAVPPDTGPTIAIYKFDETSGAAVVNSVQNRFNGSIYGASRVAGKVANALQFGVAGSRAEIPMSSLTPMSPPMVFTTGEISIDTWIRLDTPGTFYHLIGSGYWGLKSFRLGLGNGQVQFMVYDSSAWRPVIASNQTLAPNIWYHIALTYNGSTGKIYINGMEDATNTISYVVPTSYNTLFIGATENGNFGFESEFQGTMDEIRLFRVTLSASQVLDYYNSTK